MKTKLLLAIGLIAAVAVWMVAFHRAPTVSVAAHVEHVATSPVATPRPTAVEEIAVEVPVEPVAAASSPQEVKATAHISVPARVTPVRKTASSTAPVVAEPVVAQPKRRELGDPVARVALSLVGEDPDAEVYWVEAINDPNLSAHERSDLIEDLNEEGFEDPRHPTSEDLPIIVSRLALIEELAPDAMDEVNSDAFAEAWKDLAKMADVAEQN